MTKRQRLIVLDRDGVINRDSSDFIKSPDEWQPLPGSLDAIGALSDAGFTVVVATNQSGIGRGLFDRATLDAIHAKMTAAVHDAGGKLDGIFICPHGPDDGCDCRKPLPGLLRQIETQLDCSPENQVAIGDSARDLEAAAAIGAQPILVRTGNGAKTEKSLPASDEIPVFDDLAAVARALIEQEL